MEISFKLTMNGSLIDRDASMNGFEEYLTNLVAEQEQEQEKIGEAVSALFDKNMGKRLPLDYVISQTLIALNAQPENHKAMYRKVNTYIHDHAGEDKTFHIGRGRGLGGVGRIADLAK